ncbi:MAG: hypothetical protein HC836_18035 [Richelia sp. RM2_1_2]|nr:hypothetical protein [Richelia sp. RM1_1_1]NJO60098.1 hypothetical protein [Richelia sp. RM2_1_2]
MTDYQLAISPWCIFKTISSGYQMCIARLRTRQEAENYLECLQRLMPNARLEIAFTTEDLRRENSTTACSEVPK